MTEPIKVAEAFYAGVQSGDLSEAPLAADLRYEGPLIPELRGSDNVRRLLGGYLATVRKLEVVRHIADHDHVVTELAVQTAFADFPMLYVARIEDDLIVELRAFYDPRPFLEGMGEH